MKKRILTIAVAALAVMLCVFAFTACGEEEGAPEFNPYPFYSFTKVGETLTLDVSLKSQLPAGALILPSSTYYYADAEGGETKKHDKALPVSAIADGAFQRAGRITSIEMGNTYTTIGEDCFSGCDKLTSVVLSENITAIPDGAFEYCTELKSVTGGGNITSIGAGAFLSSYKLNSLGIGWSSSFTIGNDAFFYAISLRSIDLTRASFVGSRAFKGWQGSQTITEPSNTSSWATDWK